MQTLYIANATSRNHHFHYRVPEVSRLFDQEIPAGQQWQIPEVHRSPEAIAAIVDELVRYGAIPRSSVGRDKKFSGIIFADKPISIEAIPKTALMLALWPMVKKWCSQTAKDRTAMAIVAVTIAR